MENRRRVLELFESQKDVWERRASEGIENYRKGDAKIVIKDKNGNAVKNAKIKASQKTHEFKFGANIFMLDEFETDEKNALYKKYFAETFNMATLPFYWNDIEPVPGQTRYDKDSPKIYRRPAIDLCMEFCEEHGIEPREHALAYEHNFPNWLADKSTPEIKELLEKRFKEIADRYKDKIPTIEVVNEMEWKEGKTAFYDDPDYITWCYKMAEKYFPDNELAINEGNKLSFDDPGCRVTTKYFAYIENAILKGARIDAIGMQYHMCYPEEDEYNVTRYAYYNPEEMYRRLDLYATLGKPLQLTEITFPAYGGTPENEEIQAELLEKLYTLWFSHPNMEQIIYWNLVDGYAYVEDPNPEKIKASQGDMTLGENQFWGGLLRFDLTPKPAFYKLQELTQKVWHTEASLISNLDGKATFRGFYGKYDVEIEVDGNTVTKEINLSKKSDNTFEIIL